MKEQFVHTLTNSFMLWFDNFLLKKGEAFSNQTGTFYHTPDDFLDDSYVPFSSPYKQFVTDSSIAGAQKRACRTIASSPAWGQQRWLVRAAESAWWQGRAPGAKSSRHQASAAP